MTGSTTNLPAIDYSITAPMETVPEIGAWTVVRIPDTRALLGTGKAVKVAGTIDGHAFAATMLPLGDGSHCLPIKAAVRKTIGKQAGDTVSIHLDQRFS